MSNTPEWFRLTADDQKPVSAARKPFRKSIKFSLIAAPLLLIGVFGAVAVGTHEDFDDEAPMVSKSNAVVSSVANSDNAKVNIASNQTNGNSITSALENSGAPGTSGASGTSGKGMGVPAPSAQTEHEEDDDDGFFGHNDDDEHERRERHHEGREH
jgi:hypothetical protein